MDSTSMPQSSGKKKKTNITRRSWTLREDQALISALKDIVSQGWKCDNGFKTGFLNVLEQQMRQALPGCDLKADPHIVSKIHVWKKNYGTLSTMLSRSGFGWNDTSATLDIADDQVWDEYVKSDPNARTMRYKAWPLYKDWLVIFGKDRATGENAEACVDAVNDLVLQDHRQSDVSAGADYVPTNITINDDGSEYMSSYRNDGATSSKGKKKMHKRQKKHDETDGQMVNLMSDFFEKAESRLGELVKRIGFEYDASAMRSKVFDALSDVVGLTIEEKITVAKVICNSTKNLDIFFSLTNVHKEVMVRMILDGKF